MSHTMNISIEIHDRAALLAACERLGLRTAEGEHRLCSSNEVGLAVFLPGWLYPVVVREDGSVAFDNYHGQWGQIGELNILKAYYGLEKAKAEAHRKGYLVYEAVNEQTRELELRVRVGGA
jgi:hypothetical protein